MTEGNFLHLLTRSFPSCLNMSQLLLPVVHCFLRSFGDTFTLQNAESPSTAALPQLQGRMIQLRTLGEGAIWTLAELYRCSGAMVHEFSSHGSVGVTAAPSSQLARPSPLCRSLTTWPGHLFFRSDML